MMYLKQKLKGKEKDFGSRTTPTHVTRISRFSSTAALIFAMTSLVFSANGVAATYYLSSTVGADSGSGTSGAPWLTFSHALSTMTPGDTLIVKDGTYNQSINPSKSGTAGNPITIKAENAGQVTIDMQGSGSGINIENKAYLTIEGFLVINPGGVSAINIGGHSGPDWSDRTNNIIVRNTGARGGEKDSNTHVWSIGRIKDSLFEDVWGWGDGRYIMNVFGSDNVTVRRAVFRWDRWDGLDYKPNDPKFNMAVYNTHNSTFENILLFDAGDKNHGAINVPGNPTGDAAPHTSSSYNRFLGSVLLNNAGTGVNMESGGGLNIGNRFIDIVSWGNGNSGLGVNKKAKDTHVEHVTLGENTRHGTWFNPNNEVTGSVVRNSLIYSNGLIGQNGNSTDDYNNVYGNGTNYNGSPGSHDISADPALKYILRLEDNSPGKGLADDGGDMGATVVKRYVDGTLTSADLWPWPNESLIKEQMCGAGYLTSIGRSGSNTPDWCQSGKTLTAYIWEYLGNAMPGGMYTDATPPTGTVKINNGAAKINSIAVTLELSATDNKSGVIEMQFSNDGTNWSALEAYSSSKSWNLSSGDGSKTVFVKFKDGAGNLSDVADATIELDTVAAAAPTGGRAEII